MRYWKMMVGVGAATLVSAGSARAVERVDGAATPERQETSWAAKGGEPPAPARAKTDGVNADASGYVTHDQLEEYTKEIIERLDRERNAQVSPPTFTDAG
jgi:hypothetical protein